MLTQSLNTSISSTKAAPVPFAKPDQFCGLTGHAGLVASEFSYQKDEEVYGEDELAEYVYQVFPARSGATSCSPMAAGKSARSTCPATCSGWNRAPPTA